MALSLTYHYYTSSHTQIVYKAITVTWGAQMEYYQTAGREIGTVPEDTPNLHREFRGYFHIYVFLCVCVCFSLSLSA